MLPVAVAAVVLAVIFGPLVGAAMFGPLALVAGGVVLSLARRDDPLRHDERARYLDLQVGATSFNATAGFLLGAAVYRWSVHGWAAAEPLIFVGWAAVVIYVVTSIRLRRHA